jgi:hypothetical protein
MIIEYVAILKVDFRRFGLSHRKSEFFNTIDSLLPVGGLKSCRSLGTLKTRKQPFVIRIS